MRITFSLPITPGLAGGYKVVFQYSNKLVERGHRVTIIYPAQRADADPQAWLGTQAHLRFLKHRWTRLRNPRVVDWFQLNPQVRLVEVPTLAERYIPDADIVVATLWSTAPWVKGYSARKGRKFHLIQHYETVMGDKESVDATWRLPLRKIVIATWLRELAEKQFGVTVYDLIINGIDFHEFYNDQKEEHNPLRIGMMYHGEPWKGSADGIAAFEIARDRHPGIRLSMFGVYPPDLPLPEYIEFHRRPFGERLRLLYCSFDIFLSPSWIEGCQAPPAEAMACKCAVVATNVGCIPDYAIAGETALVSPPRDPTHLAENLVALLDDSILRNRLAQAGYVRIREFTWDKATDKLEAAFARAREEKG